MTEQRRHDLIAFAILALVPTLLFLDVLAGSGVLYARDTVAYYFPAKKVLRDIVLGGEFPYWNPFFSAGQPIAANPEHEVFYPLTWLILLPDYITGLNLLGVAHIYIAIFTMYALLRSMSLGRPASVFGAISFGIGGTILSTLNLFPCLFILAWLPLTCLYTRRFLRSRAPRDFALASLFLGLQLLIGEPVTSLITGMLLGFYAIASGWREGGAATAARRVLDIAGISIAALLVSAVQIVPAVDHLRDSVRSRGLDFAQVEAWSMPWQRLIELFNGHGLGWPMLESHNPFWGKYLYPDRLTPFLLSIYPGLAATVLATAGVVARLRGWKLFLLTSAVSIVLAAGSHTPLLRFLYDHGLARSTRYSEKFVMMLGFALPVFAAMALDRLLRGDELVKRATVRVAACIAAIGAAYALLTLTPLHARVFERLWALDSAPAVAVLALERRTWLIAVAGAVLLLVIARNSGRVRAEVWLALLGAFVLLDLGPRVPELAPRQPRWFYSEPPEATLTLPRDRSQFRVFHYAQWAKKSAYRQVYNVEHPDRFWIVRNSMAPMIPAAYGIRTALEVDFDLTALLPTVDFTEAVLDLAEAHANDWINIAAATSNVWYIAVYEKPEIAFAKARGSRRDVQPVRFVEGKHYPRYWFATTLVPIRNGHDFVSAHLSQRYPRDAAFIEAPGFTPAGGVVRRVRESANRIALDVTAAGRGFLVLSVTPHKYWTITVDGEPVPAVITNVGYQGIVVPAGTHAVEMRYRNPLIAFGACITAAALLALALIARRSRPLPGGERRSLPADAVPRD